MSNVAHWDWYRIAFKRASKGLPELDLSRLPKDDIRRFWYLFGQLNGARARKG